MGDWRYIVDQNNIDEFVKETMGMHDSVIVGLDYMAGSWSDDITTCFSGPNSKNLRVIFDSPWIEGKIEMVFETVCRFNIAGWQECYSDEIFACSIKLEKLKETSDETYILWTAGGSPRARGKEELLSEPLDTYIISKRVRWRIEKLNYKCPCCGYYTFEHLPIGELEICPVCCWYDDTECLENLDYINPCLGVSLKQARKNYLVNRVCKEKFLSEVRLPMENELDGINWIVPVRKYN